MKFRTGFISNSSSTTFIITNKTDKELTIVDFCEENPQLVDQWNEEYGKNAYPGETPGVITLTQLVESAKEELILDQKRRDNRSNLVFKPKRQNYCNFGDEDGTIIGYVFDYILRDGGESKSFTWEFYEYNR